MIRSALFLLVAIMAGPGAPFDSDGYYCVGPGYVAWQYGLVSGQPHQLYVVRVGAPDLISPPDTVPLPEFQVHGLLCEADAIEVASWRAVHTVPLDEGGRPGTLTETAHAPGEIPERFRGRQPNLGRFGNPGRTPLSTDDQGTEYFLEIGRERPLEEPCTAHRTSRIVAVDASGREIAELVLFDGTIGLECGHG